MRKGCIFITGWELNYLAANYSRFCPLFTESVYARCKFKCRVDRTHKVKYGHRTQLVQNSNLHAPSLTPEEATRIGWDPDWAGDATMGP
eukprot:3977068-Karenia_brevis.AAC.1